jgi:hypothetical protein
MGLAKKGHSAGEVAQIKRDRNCLSKNADEDLGEQLREP